MGEALLVQQKQLERLGILPQQHVLHSAKSYRNFSSGELRLLLQHLDIASKRSQNLDPATQAEAQVCLVLAMLAKVIPAN